MNHSNQIREFILSGKGIKLVEVYLGPAGMLTGSARVALQEQERDASMRQSDESELKLAQLEHKRKAMEAHIEALRAEFEADSAAVKKAVSLDTKREERLLENQSAMAKSRKVGGNLPQASKGK
jgi:circadian clock protein KaiC